MVVKKGYYDYFVIQTSNQQKFVEEKRLSKCGVIIFIENLCILNNQPPKMDQFSKFKMLIALKKLNGVNFIKI